MIPEILEREGFVHSDTTTWPDNEHVIENGAWFTMWEWMIFRRDHEWAVICVQTGQGAIRDSKAGIASWMTDHYTATLEASADDE